MLMIILESPPRSLKGELSRYLMEPKAGVFLGHVSALVRDALWEKCKSKIRDGGAILIYSYPTEQGFKVDTCGTLTREIIDHEGLYFVRKPFD